MASYDFIIQSTYQNPEVLAVGFIAGFILAKVLGMRKNRMGMGGGF